MTNPMISLMVSTHSRPKAAGRPDDKPDDKPDGFNTQPPEGGWNGWSASN